MSLIDAAFSRARTIWLLFILLLFTGASAYVSIPKESDPDVAIPMLYVVVTHEGISPEDSERLLVRPLEKELQSIEGLKELRATATQGHAAIVLEFDAGFDSAQALQDVREKVDTAKAELPPGSDEPEVHEINVALFPILTVVLAGPVPERTLVTMANQLQDAVETLPGVLEAEIGGDREEALEILVDPTVMETYGINYSDIFSLVRNNNMLVAAGAMDTGAGRFVFKVPGVIESIEDVQQLPVKVVDDTTVTFSDIAVIRRTFKDPSGFARVNGQPALTLEISKRVGANIIETVEGAKAIVQEFQQEWPDSVQVTYMHDKSKDVRNLLGDLENNVLSAILLVMIVIVAALGLRSSLLVGLAIPGSFVIGILIIQTLGFTLNIVVLFSLILVVGMLVDGAIVVIELAERHLTEGQPAREAFRGAAKRMAWPICASTATTLAVFLPLLFWPGVVGEFMKYLPATVLVTLAASLAMALIFVPVVGATLLRRRKHNQLPAERSQQKAASDGFYVRLLETTARRPVITLLTVCALIALSYWSYARWGKGIEFFPSIEPEYTQVQIHARDDLSIWEQDRLVRQVEQRLLKLPYFDAVYARTLGNGQGGDQLAEDVIGVIQLDLLDWQLRPPAAQILPEIRTLTEDIAGIVIEVREQEQGPGSGKPVDLNLSSSRPDLLPGAVEQVRQAMERIDGFIDIEDDRPKPGIEWTLEVDREKAARYGADINLVGNAVQMLTGGIRLAEYRPDDADEELEIRIRFPSEQRHLDQLRSMRVMTGAGQVPISNFVQFVPTAKTGVLKRVDGQRIMGVSADVEDGLLVNDQLRKLKAALAGIQLPEGVQVNFKGQDKDQQEAASFLGGAFLIAVFIMAGILVTQFNSYYQAILVLSAIVFSTAGVLIGLLVTAQPFGIVMGGIGVIALAGIVVNNNIVLIDTYNLLLTQGYAPLDAVIETGRQRLRPVLLTSVTTILGLLPMVFSLNIDLLERTITVGAPSTQWWNQLASAIAGGLAFATVLTLILTPSLLMLGQKFRRVE